MQPKVSIIIPTYNRSRYLAQAIDGALRQTYPNLETLVLDNASTDDTPVLLERYRGTDRLQYVRNETNLGMVRNWWKGVHECATGDWFLILSDDDYLIDDDYIAKAVDIIHADPEIVFVYANGYILEEDSGQMVPLQLPFNRVNRGRDVFLTRGISPQDFTLCNILFKRELALQLRAFSNPFDIRCDSELFLRMCLRGNVGFCADPVSVYRRHASNLIGGYKRDFDLVLHSLDWVFYPYTDAMSLGVLSEPELDAWRKKVVVVTLKGVLRDLRTFHRPRYEEGVAAFRERYGPLFDLCLAELPLRFQPGNLGRFLRSFYRIR